MYLKIGLVEIKIKIYNYLIKSIKAFNAIEFEKKKLNHDKWYCYSSYKYTITSMWMQLIQIN